MLVDVVVDLPNNADDLIDAVGVVANVADVVDVRAIENQEIIDVDDNDKHRTATFVANEHARICSRLVEATF